MSSIAETHLLAIKAREKLTKAASASDHDLRVLVSHANLLDNLMDRIQNHKYTVPEHKPISYKQLSPLGDATVTFVEDYSDDDDDDSDESDDEDYRYSTEISYSSDDSEDEEEYEDDFSSDDSEDDEEDDNIAWVVKLQRVSSSNFRSLPTIDELSEQELDDLEGSQSESEIETQEEETEGDEVDIVDLKKTPSLNYSSSTEDEDEDEDEEEVIKVTEATNNSDINQSYSKTNDDKSHDLFMENFHDLSFHHATTTIY